jgi:4-amino-4-deoxy-L-arabinose transferase-like glycosyltransferase
VFFSLSAGKRGLYMLPAFPAAALLCADAVAQAWSRRTAPPVRVTRALGVVAASFAVAALVAMARGEIAGVAVPVGAALGLVGSSAAAVAGWRFAARARDPARLRVGVVVAFAFAVELCVFTLAFPALDPEKSPRPVAEAAAALTPPGEAVGLVSKRSLVGGLLYYGERPVSLLESPDAVAEFVERGGRAIVVPESRIEGIGDLERFDRRARFRSGRRTLLVVTPARAPE